uniref:Uncharacterized protein n=1 Tax=Lygus hesperus TaxID=30085 RepID=A0A0A9WIF6_LYGHE
MRSLLLRRTLHALQSSRSRLQKVLGPSNRAPSHTAADIGAQYAGRWVDGVDSEEGSDTSCVESASETEDVSAHSTAEHCSTDRDDDTATWEQLHTAPMQRFSDVGRHTPAPLQGVVHTTLAPATAAAQGAGAGAVWGETNSADMHP